MRIHKDGEDKRFRTIKPSPSQFFMTWTLQGLWVSLCSMCALTAISTETGLIINALLYIGLILFVTGFLIEIIADKQKSKFRAIPENKDKFITSGLWARSRHPNYFGEIVLWSGIAVMSFSSLEGLQYLTLISPIFTYLLLVYVSGVRMLEARGDIKWSNNEDYKNYKENTPVLLLKLTK
jgi:steroid 5-alpha reductase family enzyme